MVNSEDLDAVSICTPHNIRLSVIKPVAEKGIHAVIENHSQCPLMKLKK